MTWPTVAIDTTDIDAGTDSPASARADLKDAIDKLNQMISHVSTFAATVLDDATAAAMRSTLGSTTTGDAVFVAATAAAARMALGSTTTGDAVFVAATAAAARTALGSTTTGDAVFVAATAAAARTALGFDGPIVPRGYIDGLVMSTAGSSTTMTIGAGHAADVDLGALISLDAAISKTTAAWAVGTGNGGLDTGTIANSTWYHFWLIRRPDTGVEDVLISLSATSPTMPANYTQRRRIGSGLTNGSGNWTRFVQYGDDFIWYQPMVDVATTNPGASAVSASLTLPSGVKVEALLNASIRNTGLAVYVGVYISSLDVSDDAAAETGTAGVAGPLTTVGWSDGSAAGNRSNSGQVRVWTNTSRQVRYRLNNSDASTAIYIATLGWRDPRGRDA